MRHTLPQGEPVRLNERVRSGLRDDYGIEQYPTVSRVVAGVAIRATSSGEVRGGQQNHTNSNYTVVK